MWFHALTFLIIVVSVSAAEVNFGTLYKFYQKVAIVNHKQIDTGSYKVYGNVNLLQISDSLLAVQLSDLKLHIKKGKVPTVIKTLDAVDNSPFLIHRSDGTVDNIYIPNSEDEYSVNIKKSIASLLQFQTDTLETKETDVSGECRVKYLRKSSVINKFKLCDDGRVLNNSIWGSHLIPKRVGEIKLTENKLNSVIFRENFSFQLSNAEFVTTLITTETSLILESDIQQDAQYENKDLNSVIAKAEKSSGKKYLKHDLLIKKSPEKYSLKLHQVIKEHFKSLQDNELGSSISAVAAIEVIEAVEQASSKDIYSALTKKGNKKIVSKLLDILGAVQTDGSHEAAVKFLNLTTKECDLDLSERYFWALSTSPNAKKFILTDLIELLEKKIENPKLLETLVQTISSLLRKHFVNSGDEHLLDKIVKMFLEKLKSCEKTDETCQRTYLKAFSNLKSPIVKNDLFEVVLNGPRRAGFRAMKALHSLGPQHWTNDILRLAEYVYFSNGTFDSSAKVIALDMLLGESKDMNSYSKVIQLLKCKHASYELKEMLLQRLAQISEYCKDTKRLIKSTLMKEGLYHVDALAQGGLSTAFDRSFMKKGFFSNAQEVKNGLLKHGYVHVNLKGNDAVHTVFTLGLFSNGLSSFMSDEAEDEEDEGINAGLELTVLGVEFRPFIFFEGQGELMGHVFSGAGSTLTPAYQALLLLNHDEINIPLATGDLLSFGSRAVASVDLSGKIEISLWSRAAESLVQNRAGIALKRSLLISNPIATLKENSFLTAEPQLFMTSNIQFSSKVALCIQLQQPDSILRLNTSTETTAWNKLERRLKNTQTTTIPGKSYVLNQKNNEMCNTL